MYQGQLMPQNDRVCMCMQVWGAHFSKKKKPSLSLTSCPHLLKMEKGSFVRGWKLRLREQSPYKGVNAEGALKCQNKPSFWEGLIGDRSMSLFHARRCFWGSVHCPTAKCMIFDVWLLGNGLIGGNEEVDTATKHTGWACNKAWKNFFLRLY